MLTSANASDVEAALRESEDKFRRIVEFANVGIAIVQDARFRFVNPCCAAMYGYTADELLNTEFTGYCAPEERDRIAGFNVKRMKGEPAPPRYETAVLRKDGQRAYVDVSVGLIPYEGRPASFVYLVDMTERKRAEQALQERLAFEQVITGISTEFINLGPDEIDAGILDALQVIGEFTGD